jgi:hypothetical protein
VLFAVDLDLGAAVLTEEHAIARLHVELAHRAVLEHLAVAHRDDFALDGLLFRRIGDNDAAFGLLFFFNSLDDHAVLKRANGHGLVLLLSFVPKIQPGGRGTHLPTTPRRSGCGE